MTEHTPQHNLTLFRVLPLNPFSLFPHLSVRHAPALKPAVKHIINTPQHTLALAAWDGDVVNKVTVEVSHLFFVSKSVRCVFGRKE